MTSGIFGQLLRPRRPEDVLSGEIRVEVGGQPYVLPVLSIAANRRWKSSLTTEMGGLVAHLDDASSFADIYAALAAAEDNWLTLLRSYDQTHVLPDDLDEHVRPDELIAAVLEVWAAANPLVGMGLALGSGTNGTSPGRTNGSPKSTAGRRRRSKAT